MPSVLVTLGRLPKGLDLIRSFHARGWRVIVADPYRNHLARASRTIAKSYHVPAPSFDPKAYEAALLEIVKQHNIDLILPVSEDILYVSALRERLPAHVRLISMPHDLIHHVHDKYEFIMLAREIGLSVPDTALLHQAKAFDIAARGDYIVKPRHSCAGFGVSIHKRLAPLPTRSGALVQTAIRGDEVSTCALVFEGKILGQAIYRGTLQSGTVAVGFERVENQAIDDWVARFAAATRWSGFISFDFMVDDDGIPYAIECNPRTTSGLHFFKTTDLAKAILEPDHKLSFRRQRRFIQFWSVMQHFSDQFGNLAEMRRALRHIITTRDVTWSWSDPLPLLLMPWTAQEIMQASKRDHVPFGIAATRDFAYPPNGDAQ